MWTVLALGSNLGNRRENIKNACEFLLLELRKNHPQAMLTFAPILESEPVDCPDGSGKFLNTVIAFDFFGSAEELHAITKSIEKKLGRTEQSIRNSPRMIDLDIVIFGDTIIHSPELTIPHPRLHERRFVLEPLSSIAAELILPHTGKTVAEHLEILK